MAVATDFHRYSLITLPTVKAAGLVTDKYLMICVYSFAITL